jgi:phosphate transport system permease protein
LRDLAATGWLWASLVVALVPLGFVVAYVVGQGAQIISWEFLTSDLSPSSRRPGGGIAPAIVGTLIITGAATAMAVPLGLLGAIYLHEYGRRNRLATVIRFMSDVMTGVPSIVMGLFIYTVWVLRFGQTGFAGSLALGSLMLPIGIRSSEEMLRLVPDELRHASYALGTRQWRTIITVVLPAALPGITSGVMLAVARAAGETAPLLFTTGIVYRANPNLFEGANVALPTLIFDNANQPFEVAIQRAWGAALTLIVLVLTLTVLARWIANRFAITEG